MTQLTRHPPQENSHAQAEPAGAPGFVRACDECGTEYKTLAKASQFCSDKCRCRARRRRLKASNGMEKKKDQNVPSVKEAVASNPLLSSGKLSPEMTIAVDLLRKECDRMERLYNEERTTRKKLQEELQKLKDDAREKDHARTLQGLEDRKPDLIDRISNLPAPILEAFTPLLGRLGKLMIPDEPGAAGAMNGQLDQAYQELFNWISNLTDEQKKAVMAMNYMVSQSDPANLEKIVQQINNLLTNGTTANSTREFFDKTMYSN